MQAYSTSRIEDFFTPGTLCFSLTVSLKSRSKSKADGLTFSAVRFARPGKMLASWGIQRVICWRCPLLSIKRFRVQTMVKKGHHPKKGLCNVETFKLCWISWGPYSSCHTESPLVGHAWCSCIWQTSSMPLRGIYLHLLQAVPGSQPWFWHDLVYFRHFSW